jgi:diguanylate cyclase (GGDEF)-like protein
MPVYGLLEEALVSDLPLQGRVDLPGGFADGDGSVLAVGLRGRADSVGLLLLGCRGAREFDAHDVAFVALVAEHVGMALANADQLLREARTDHLTQLANRPEFDRAGQRTVASARRYGRPFTVMLLDLDNLKAFNDRYGHHRGDAAIQAVAHALRKTVRATDVCARLGGDEFGVVMPEAGADEAREVAERVRKALREASTEAELPKPARVSIGFATWDQNLDWRQLLRLAAERLYENKRRRRRTSADT